MRQFSQPILSVLELRQSSTGATSVAMRRRRVEVHSALARRPSPVGASAMILWREQLNVLRSVEADSPKPVAPKINDRITVKPGQAKIRVPTWHHHSSIGAALYIPEKYPIAGQPSFAPAIEVVTPGWIEVVRPFKFETTRQKP